MFIFEYVMEHGTGADHKKRWHETVEQNYPNVVKKQVRWKKPVLVGRVQCVSCNCGKRR